MIDPKEIIKKHSVEHFCKTAEEYIQQVIDPIPLMCKPFNVTFEAPELLTNLGMLLSGLNLGKSMTILDFGAGTCWISRFLNQMQCITISCDASKTALKIGEKLFERSSILREYVIPPKFLHFDGHKIDLPNNSVDRIICYDAFHHVPNQEKILSEFYRILEDGGIVGFSEPGKNHSKDPKAQYEMKTFKVLENDIDIVEIEKIAKKSGFTNLIYKIIGEKDVTVSELNALTSLTKYNNAKTIKKQINKNIIETTKRKSIFFLYKGQIQYDSRNHLGLSHSIKIKERKYKINQNEELNIHLTITNTGFAKWLHRNIKDIGIVRLGAHLYSSEKELIDIDFYRKYLDKDILPGETILETAAIKLNKPGKYLLCFDLVSEFILWFKESGSKPIYVEVIVK